MGSFKPSPCSDEELRSTSSWYFDWNIERCHQSHLSVCPGDEERLFANDLNSFPKLEDCLSGTYLFLSTQIRDYHSSIVMHSHSTRIIVLLVMGSIP